MIVEVTGEKKKDKASKVSTARNLWVPAINNHGGFGRWAFIEISDPWDAKNKIREMLAHRPESVDDTEPLIRKTPGVCGGAAYIRKTRIPVWTLVHFRELGALESDLLSSYPSLTPKDLRAAWDYYERNQEEVYNIIRSQESDSPSNDAL